MTIKEVAQLTGLSHQAIYKKIKNKGISLEGLKDKATGQFTPEGEAAIKALFGLGEKQETPVATEVAKLTTEIERLRNLVDKQEVQLAALKEERDYLRGALDKQIQIQAMMTTKLPTPPPALPAGKEHRLRNWLQRLRGGKDSGN